MEGAERIDHGEIKIVESVNKKELSMGELMRDTLKKYMNGAFICLDKDIDALADEVGAEVLGEAIMAHNKALNRLAESVSEFYQFSGSDDECWDEWTSDIAADAHMLFKDIQRAARELKRDRDLWR